MYSLQAYLIHCTLRQNRYFTKITFRQNTQSQKCPHFFLKLQLITVLLLICDFFNLRVEP